MTPIKRQVGSISEQTQTEEVIYFQKKWMCVPIGMLINSLI
jgi:hypothetical protein